MGPNIGLFLRRKITLFKMVISEFGLNLQQPGVFDIFKET